MARFFLLPEIGVSNRVEESGVGVSDAAVMLLVCLWLAVVDVALTGVLEGVIDAAFFAGVVSSSFGVFALGVRDGVDEAPSTGRDPASAFGVFVFERDDGVDGASLPSVFEVFGVLDGVDVAFGDLEGVLGLGVRFVVFAFLDLEASLLQPSFFGVPFRDVFDTDCFGDLSPWGG